MEDPAFIYYPPNTITLANSASSLNNYYVDLMITISDFAENITVADNTFAAGVSIDSSQPGPDNTITFENASTEDNYYTGYSLSSGNADLEYNKIVSYEGASEIAFLETDYTTKPSGTCDIDLGLDMVSFSNASVEENYYTGYHLIDLDPALDEDGDPILEFNIINYYDGNTQIAYMGFGYDSDTAKPSGTCDIGYPVQYVKDYDGDTKEVVIGGGYTNVPLGGETYTIEGGVSASSGYVDGTGVQFKDIYDGTLLVKDTTIKYNWRGLWFRHIPNTNNNFSNPNVLIQGTTIEYNMGIGIRADEVANVVIGDVNYTPSVWYQGKEYTKMNGMRGEGGLFNSADGNNQVTRSAKRNALVADAMANGGISVFKNGSWGGQLQGYGDYGYETNIWVNGGQFRGNGSQGIGTKGNSVM